MQLALLEGEIEAEGEMGAPAGCAASYGIEDELEWLGTIDIKADGQSFSLDLDKMLLMECECERFMHDTLAEWGLTGRYNRRLDKGGIQRLKLLATYRRQLRAYQEAYEMVGAETTSEVFLANDYEHTIVVKNGMVEYRTHIDKQPPVLSTGVREPCVRILER
jgi:hypothetical protein